MNNELEKLIDAYVSLLKIQDIGIRLDLQSTYCFLRNKVAELSNQSSKYVQEKYEEIAVCEKGNSEKLMSLNFKKFIGFVNYKKLLNWSNLTEHYWDQYKYSKTEE